LEQCLCEVGADEARAACDQCVHADPPM
jgi:hypothetical protein